MRYKFSHFFSMDNPKAVKAQKLGWLNAINYMAPHKLSGKNLCPFASKACIKACLGKTSGNAALYPTVLQSRIRKAKWFMSDRQSFLYEMYMHIKDCSRKARKAKLQLCVRLNGATDIAWESIKADGWESSMIEIFPNIEFVDYTKSVKRALDHAAGKLPPNYHLTFSRSETNEDDCRRVLAAGGNVAVVFGCPFPRTYLGCPVWDGDKSDLRHLDPQGGWIVALSPKGLVAAKDTSGFVVWSCDLTIQEAAS